MVTVIGDVHGKWDEYYNIVKDKEHSVQLGDFGFSRTWNKLHYSGLSPDNHKIICGNHDDYDICPMSPYYLGDFGEAAVGGLTFFFIRGGLSIDRVYRVGEELSGGSKTWWSQEELNLTQMVECIALYKEVKPDIVMSHVPCGFFTPYILGNKSDDILQKFKFHAGFKENTQLLGNELLKIHKPRMWFCGHMHSLFQGIVEGVQVIALRELETFELG